MQIKLRDVFSYVSDFLLSTMSVKLIPVVYIKISTFMAEQENYHSDRNIHLNV